MKRMNTVDLFHNPKSITEVEEWIERHNGSEKAHLYTASMMTWNLLVTMRNSQVDLLQDVIGLLLEQVQDYSENEIVNGDGRAMTIEQIKELIAE